MCVNVPDRRIWLGDQTGLPVDLLNPLVVYGLTVIGDANVSGKLIVQGDIETAYGNITSNHAVIGHHIFAFERNGDLYGGVVGSWDPVTLKGAGFRLNANTNPATMEFGPADPAAGILTKVSMTLTGNGDLYLPGSMGVTGNLAVTDIYARELIASDGVWAHNQPGVFGFSASGGNFIFSWGVGGVYDFYEPASNLWHWRWNDTDVMTLSPTTGLNVVGDVIATGDIETASNLTSAHAVIGHHLFAYDKTPGVYYGGVIGSWDTDTARGAGFRFDGNSTPARMEFGPADPSSGILTAVGIALDVNGNLAVTGNLYSGADTNVTGNLGVTGNTYANGKVVMSRGMQLHGISPYVDNSAAIAAGLGVAEVYFNTTYNALSLVL